MERRNVRVSISSEVRRKRRIIALEQKASKLSGGTAQMKLPVEGEEEYERAVERALDLMRRGFGFETNGKASWTRDQLHER